MTRELRAALLLEIIGCGLIVLIAAWFTGKYGAEPVVLLLATLAATGNVHGLVTLAAIAVQLGEVSDG